MENSIKYLKQNHIKLSQDKIKELFNDKEANKELIVKSQMALIMRLAQQFHSFNPTKTFDEIVSDCMLGLMTAIKYYDNTRGVDFTAYAYTSIKHGIYEYRNENRIIKLSVKAALGQLPDDEVKVTTTKFEDMFNQESEQITFLDIYKSPNEDEELKDDLDRTNNLCLLIRKTFEKKEKYADILIATFGLCGKSDKVKLDDIAEMFSCSKQYIAQVKKEAIEKLKNNEEFINYLKHTYYE